MELAVKRFEELTNNELYDILKLRVNTFVVEQHCPYPELDDKDQDALHVFLRDEEGIHAYLRVMDKGVSSEQVSIGRVVAVTRRKGYGSRVLEKGMRVAAEYFQADKIYLEAQTYARGLYEKHGFRQISDVFLEDGIPHIKMLAELTEC